MRKTGLLIVLAFLSASGMAQRPDPEKLSRSHCHVFIDLKAIWTVEVIDEVPILNVITFTDEEASLRPEQVHIYDNRGRRAKIEKFSIDTGVADDPYITNYLKILGHSFFGFDLVGSFSDFAEPEKVVVELGETEYTLQPVDCLDYQMLADRVDQVNYNSPDIKDDFAVLKIPQLGSKRPRRKGRR